MLEASPFLYKFLFNTNIWWTLQIWRNIIISCSFYCSYTCIQYYSSIQHFKLYVPHYTYLNILCNTIIFLLLLIYIYIILHENWGIYTVILYEIASILSLIVMHNYIFLKIFLKAKTKSLRLSTNYFLFQEKHVFINFISTFYL